MEAVPTRISPMVPVGFGFSLGWEPRLFQTIYACQTP
jgi:hypothetical protein